MQWLPNEPLHLRRNITVYSIFVLFVSVAGFVGAVKVRRDLIDNPLDPPGPITLNKSD